MSNTEGVNELAAHTCRAFDWEHAHSALSDLCHLVPQRCTEILHDLDLPAEWIAGKRVLDAGCGAGRWSWALATLGAHVTAVDFTASGVAATRRALAPFPDCRVLQADLTTLDLGDEQFDLVLSWGVLHHTADPPATFRQLVPRYVAPGGYAYVMVYGHHWTAAPHQEALTNLVRAMLRHLSPEDRWEACRALVLTDPVKHRTLWPHLYVYHADPDDPPSYLRALFACYDCYSPAWNYRYAYNEVVLWFSEAGLTEIRPTPGETDGAVHVRGRRLPAGRNTAK